MNLLLKLIILFSLPALLMLGCGPHTETPQQKPETVDSLVSEVRDRELAEAFVSKLKKEPVDTIIFYKRVCIDCCEFYNVFWTAKGKYYLNKFYFDFTDRKTHEVQIDIPNDTLFNIINKNYGNLKHSTIKQNVHKQKDGTSTILMIDHYCYTELSIYTPHDSIISNSMTDHDFDKYTAYHPTPADKKETNDNYQLNKQSKWNELLMAIERKLSVMKETGSRELETLRGN